MGCEKLLEEIVKGKKAVLFTSKHCGACRRIMEMDLKELGIDESEFDGIDTLVQVDIDTCSDLADKYGIEKVPTLIITEKGEKKKELI